MGTIVTSVPLLFLLTAPGATHPGLLTRLGVCVVGGVAGVLFWRLTPRARQCQRCRPD